MKNRSPIFNIFLLLTQLALCVIAGYGSNAHAGASAVLNPIDYSLTKNWLSLPIHRTEAGPKNVDIFYVYPTTYSDKSKDQQHIIAPIDDPDMRYGAQYYFGVQAAAFSKIGNIYAPYYRQADANFVLKLASTDDVYSFIAGIPASDVISAFDYYINNYNNHRPFILVGHSQGSTVLAILLRKYMALHPEVYERMIAAYAIGWSFTPDYFEGNKIKLKFAGGADDTGVIISYNTQWTSFKARNPVVFPGAMAINPITWTTDGSWTAPRRNSGSLALDTSGHAIPESSHPLIVKGYADAHIEHIDVATSAPAADSPTKVLQTNVDPNNPYPGDPYPLAKPNDMPSGFYHTFDFAFYYANLRENAKLRVDKYCKDNKKCQGEKVKGTR